MRLICPNCGAQYEVADDVIPAAGRDVQCSNCGHTWFEQPGASVALEDGTHDVPLSAPPPYHETAPDAGPMDAAQPGLDPDAYPEANWDVFPVPDAVAPDAIAPDDQARDMPATFADAPEAGIAPLPGLRMPKRQISPQIAEILREEAAREEAARRSDAAGGLETQPELALSAPAVPGPTLSERDRADEVRRRIARLGPDVPPVARPVATNPATAEGPSAPANPPANSPARDKDPEAAAVASLLATNSVAPKSPPLQPAPQPRSQAATAARRDLLPDIEEINSTLRSTAERGPADAQTAERADSNSRGFRYGFSLILLIAAALAMVYVYTPRIVAAIPAAEPILAPYADAVDGGRLWLDLELQQLLDVIAPDAATPPAGG